jgi:hypothetical protein
MRAFKVNVQALVITKYADVKTLRVNLVLNISPHPLQGQIFTLKSSTKQIHIPALHTSEVHPAHKKLKLLASLYETSLLYPDTNVMAK